MCVGTKEWGDKTFEWNGERFCGILVVCRLRKPLFMLFECCVRNEE